MLKGIIAALWESSVKPEEVETETVFFLNGNINELPKRLKLFKNQNKKVLVDIDFISGLRSDRAGIHFLKDLGANGIITAKLKIRNIAHSIGLTSILRFFALDSRAVDRGIEQIESNKINIVEILPGIISKKVAPKLRYFIPDIKIVAAGLVDKAEEIKELKEYVNAISTSRRDLWNYKW
ncbi:MAG: glycerol-3-phosphate responsive antiterminator [Kosmotoga sp.]|nr:MAG: glycerol-3-phosphate responsive antiterminator [Kosmotoga sp.]